MDVGAYLDSEEGSRRMAIRIKAIMRPLMEEVITEKLASVVQRLDEADLVVGGLIPKIARMDFNLEYMVRRMRDEDGAKSRQSAMTGGWHPAEYQWLNPPPGRLGLAEGLTAPLEDWGHRHIGSQHYGHYIGTVLLGGFILDVNVQILIVIVVE